MHNVVRGKVDAVSAFSGCRPYPPPPEAITLRRCAVSTCAADVNNYAKTPKHFVGIVVGSFPCAKGKTMRDQPLN
jgi:hypothetical protein